MISFQQYQIEQANWSNSEGKTSHYKPSNFNFSYLFTQDRESYIKKDISYESKLLKYNILFESIANLYSSVFVDMKIKLNKLDKTQYQNNEGFLVSSPIGMLDNDGLKKDFIIDCNDLIINDVYQIPLKFIPDKKGRLVSSIFPTAGSSSIYSSWSACQLIEESHNFIKVAFSLSNERPNFSDAEVTFTFDPSQLKAILR